MERQDKKKQLTVVQMTNHAGGLDGGHLLVINSSSKMHRRVKHILKDFLFEGKQIGYLGASSLSEAQQTLEVQPDVVAVFLMLPIEDDDSAINIKHFVQTIKQNLSIQVIFYVADLVEASAWQNVYKVQADAIKLNTDLTDNRLLMDLLIALKKHKRLSALNVANRKLREQYIAQNRKVEELNQTANDGAVFKSIVETTTDLVSIVDRDGRIIYINPGGRKMIGLGQDEDVTQFHINDWYSEQADRQMLSEILPQVIEYGNGEGEFSIATGGGEKILVDQVIVAHKLPNGQIDFLSTTARDITRYKHLETSLREREQFLQLVMNNVPQYIYWKDRNSTFLGCNRNFARVAGLSSPQEITDKTDYDMPWGESEAEFYQMQDYEIMKNDHPEYHIIETQLQKDGILIWLDTNKIPLHDNQNNVIGILGTYEDITERFEAETTLREYSERLKRMVDDRTRELSEALDNLQATQEQLVETEKMAALGSLVAGVAHEINTPIGIGVTAASTLQDETIMFLDRFQNGSLKRSTLDNYMRIAQESCHLILENLIRASGLVQSFKQVAVDQTNLEYRQFIVKPYLEEVLHSLRPQLKGSKHQIVVTGDDQLVIKSFPGAFSQIITNFVVNSLLHAYDEEDKGLIVFDVKRQSDEVIIECSDDGRGISAKNIEKIFEPFFSTAKERGGSGLGLNIVYNLVTQKMKGSIECNSVLGEGTQFIIKLPLKMELSTI